MFYFFTRGSTYLRCEIRPHGTHGSYEVLVQEPEGQERVTVFPSSDLAHQFWLSLQERLNQEGWWGPSGRD